MDSEGLPELRIADKPICYVAYHEMKLSYKRLAERLEGKVKKKEKFKPKAIVAILRGAMEIARDMSDLLDVEDVYTMRIKSTEGVELTGKAAVIDPLSDKQIEFLKDKDFICVDDISDTGATLMELERYLNEAGLKRSKWKSILMHARYKAEPKGDYVDKVLEDDTWQIYHYEKNEDLRVLLALGMNKAGQTVDDLVKVCNNEDWKYKQIDSILNQFSKKRVACYEEADVEEAMYKLIENPPEMIAATV